MPVYPVTSRASLKEIVQSGYLTYGKHYKYGSVTRHDFITVSESQDQAELEVVQVYVDDLPYSEHIQIGMRLKLFERGGSVFLEFDPPRPRDLVSGAEEKQATWQGAHSSYHIVEDGDRRIAFWMPEEFRLFYAKRAGHEPPSFEWLAKWRIQTLGQAGEDQYQKQVEKLAMLLVEEEEYLGNVWGEGQFEVLHEMLNREFGAVSLKGLDPETMTAEEHQALEPEESHPVGYCHVFFGDCWDYGHVAQQVYEKVHEIASRKYIEREDFRLPCEIRCLVPLRDNSGKEIPEEVTKYLDAYLVEVAGGSQKHPGVEGSWEHDGKLYKDEMTRYTVSVSELWKVGAICNWFESYLKQCMGQESVYMEVGKSEAAVY